MPELTIEGLGSFQIKKGLRLVLAIENSGMDIGHRCGGKARCTTCRVRFAQGEPDVMTSAEYLKLNEKGLFGEARLSCQIVLNDDMKVRPLMRVSEMGWSDPGPRPSDEVEPQAQWFPIEELKKNPPTAG